MTQIEVTVSISDQLRAWRKELLDYLLQMQKFADQNPIEVQKKIGAWSARAREIRMGCIRSTNSAANNFRVKELDPFLSECEFQHKIWSRVATMTQHEWEMSR